MTVSDTKTFERVTASTIEKNVFSQYILNILLMLKHYNPLSNLELKI
jgi:hypothetical protein